MCIKYRKWDSVQTATCVSQPTIMIKLKYPLTITKTSRNYSPASQAKLEKQERGIPLAKTTSIYPLSRKFNLAVTRLAGKNGDESSSTKVELELSGTVRTLGTGCGEPRGEVVK